MDGLGVTELIARLLVNRDITTVEAASNWLHPRLRDLHDPAGLRGMSAAVEAILGALDAGQRVTIYGDYDVDGMTASSTLARFLRRCGFDPHVFLPDRFRDGYGVNADRVGELIEEGTTLFVTVDCGISAVEAVRQARELGAGFVIVDHHQLPQGPLPPARAIINPHHPDCTFPFKDMCAAGLAFHLVLGLRAALRQRGHFVDSPEPDVRELLDIVAIGTVADVVPLRGINRILVATGLVRMTRSLHPGVRALIAVGARGSRVDAGTIGYQMGPRLNAAGRLSHPYKGFELLATEDAELARSIAEDIDAENQRRREVQDAMEAEALEQVTADVGADSPALVLWSEGWHAGVAGIVAARIMQRFHRPCAVISVDGDIGKGSIRSISGFDVVAGLRRCAGLLEQFGGHPHAAGVTIRAAQLPAFRQAFADAAQALCPEDCFTPRLKVDAEVGFRDVGPKLLEQLDWLAPYGRGNPEPRLYTPGVVAREVRLVGADRSHVKLTLEHGGKALSAIAFGMADRAPAPGDRVDVAFRPEYNEWRGTLSVQLRVLDLRPSSS